MSDLVPDHLPKLPYDESRIDWRIFSGDDRARSRVGYHAFYIGMYAKVLRITEDDARRQWKQLMYFFATIHALLRMGQLLPGNKPIQPPPKLERMWRTFREQHPEHLADYCRAFFEGQDVGWRASYPPEHALTLHGLHMIRTTAELIEFEIDDELWQL